jgi:hypothetical protein
MKLYQLNVDPNATQQWFLREPIDVEGNDVDARLFTRGMTVAEVKPLTIPLRRKGLHVDFNFGDFDMVVTPSKLNVKIAQLVGTAIQRIPVTVEGCDQAFEILNVLDCVACVDEINSEYIKWTLADGRPEKIGKFRQISRLRLNSQAAQGRHLFRVAEWRISLIASEQLKALLESEGTTGLSFEPVT